MTDSNVTATYTVSGMTCQHCVVSIQEEISAVPGVLSTRVDLASGELHVQSVAPLDISQVRAAVSEAGYDLENEA